ncbi:hypothetical protein E2562_023133 [Oryza meyeriana var. granulata]|uniref:peptidylprolyl isomerase n=1 Tax=Oryza meyeriana var. granulata TaxID=110450 RepID=A0A6G1E078_9ORYZ|nr:hypothetical protein E2562_023133 [Oryza meyeriana var. granulata]
MASSELGEPDMYFHDLLHPGFAKWTVQRAAIPTHDDREQLGFLYCNEAQVHFTGKRLDGTLFASTREDGVPLTFIIPQENVMEGFSMAISSMQAGEKAIFVIPPELADTESRCPASIPGNIPPNQALRFDIELISLVTIIDIFDDEGILKKIIKDGIGSGSPRAFDQVLVSYNACMQDGVSVSKSEGVEFSLVEGFFCPAFAHAVKTMTEGEEVVLIIKPEYGFGEQGRPSIENEAAVPPDATLYVYLQLMSYKRAIHIGEGHTIFKKTLRQGKWTKMYPNQAMVRVRLIGKLQDGAVFDRRGHEGEEPFEFMVDEEQVSDSLEKAVLTMWEGEIALFTIPTQCVQDQLVVVPPGSSMTYEIELVSVVCDKDPRSMSRAERIETAVRKEKEGDKLFSSSKFLRAYRRYYKAKWIIMSIHKETDEEIKQMFVLFAFKAAECATKLQSYRQAKRHYDQILKYDPGNVKAQQLAEQPFPEDSLGIDTDALHRGLKRWADSYEPADLRTPCSASPASFVSRVSRVKAFRLIKRMVDIRPKQGRHKPGGKIFVPPIKRPDANVPTGHSPATQATSDVNRSRVTTNNENQNSGTITSPRRATVLASDGVLDHGLNLTEFGSEQGTK